LSNITNILKAREERDSIKKILCQKGNALISLNINVPGQQKSNQLLAEFFHRVKDQMKNFMLANRLFIAEGEEIILNHAAGNYFIVPIKSKNFEIKVIKQITESFEEEHPLGRFIDIDVYDIDNHAVSSGKSKKCFYCKKYPAIECRRAERHKIEELYDFQQKKIRKYLKKEREKEICRKISGIALKAILYEISLTPKPGLVDKTGSGIHTDMDYRTFIDSTSSISVFFQLLIKSGFSCKSKNLSKALPLIRQIGLKMEKEMFEQTRGVNTQKGLIFLMGISLFASAYVLKKSKLFDSEGFRETVKKICENLVHSELQTNTSDIKSHGEQCFKLFNVGGIRLEVENGFPTIFNYAIPVLETQNYIDDNVLIMCLLTIMSNLDDTNVLYRSNAQTLQLLKEKCGNLITNYSFDNYKEIIDFCISNKISPGGSADLLCISVFIYLLKINFS